MRSCVPVNTCCRQAFPCVSSRPFIHGSGCCSSHNRAARAAGSRRTATHSSHSSGVVRYARSVHAGSAGIAAAGYGSPAVWLSPAVSSPLPPGRRAVGQSIRGAPAKALLASTLSTHCCVLCAVGPRYMFFLTHVSGIEPSLTPPRAPQKGLLGGSGDGGGDLWRLYGVA
jgi:hypothetical protein